MRSFWVGLVVLAVLSTGLHALRSEAGNRKPPTRAVKTQAESPPEHEPDIVKGYGVDAAKACERALEQAQARVREKLAEKLGVSWRPSEEVLDLEYLTRFKVVSRVGEPVGVTLKDGDWLVASYQVSLNPDYLREVARVARHQQMSDRHSIAARVLVGLLALLLVATGYMRLEEMTRGYATTILRAFAVGVLLVVGLGLWVTK